MKKPDAVNVGEGAAALECNVARSSLTLAQKLQMLRTYLKAQARHTPTAAALRLELDRRLGGGPRG